MYAAQPVKGSTRPPRWSRIVRALPIASWAVLLLLSASAARAQPFHPLERIYLQTPPEVRCWNPDGTLAWNTGIPSVSNAAFARHTSIAVDPHGYVWTGVPDPVAPLVVRLTLAGVVDLIVPIQGLPFTLSPDRFGNCYVGEWVAVPTTIGWSMHLLKLSPSGQILWDVNLDPLTAPNLIPGGFLTDLQLDSEGHVWVQIQSPAPWTFGGGRLAKIDQDGTVLWDGFVNGMDVAISTTGLVWMQHEPLPSSWSGCVNGAASGGTFIAYTPMVRDPDGTCLAPIAGPPVLGGLGFWEMDSTVDGRALWHDGGRNDFWLLSVESTFSVPHYIPGAYPEKVAFGMNGEMWGFSGGWVYQPFLLYRISAPNYVVGQVATYSFQYPYYSGLWMPYTTGGRFTAHQHLLITDPWSDYDGDGVCNRNEMVRGTSPIDPGSVPVSFTAASPVIGQTAWLGFLAPMDAGLPYAVILNVTGGHVDLGDGRRVEPTPFDPLAAWAWSPPVAASTGTIGMLDAQGVAIAGIPIPPEPALVGLNIHLGFLTFSPTSILGIRSIFGPTTLAIN